MGRGGKKRSSSVVMSQSQGIGRDVTAEDLENKFVIERTLDNGKREWRNAQGELHRAGGPALIYPNGLEEWYMNGKYHREDGPARVYPDGRVEWMRHGFLHRIGAPAIEDVDESGNLSSFQYWYEGVLHREDGPAIVKGDGTEKWLINDLLHREDGPAVLRTKEVAEEEKEPTEEWWQNGQLHRENGPARIYPDGKEEFWIEGSQVKSLKRG